MWSSLDLRGQLLGAPCVVVVVVGTTVPVRLLQLGEGGRGGGDVGHVEDSKLASIHATATTKAVVGEGGA